MSIKLLKEQCKELKLGNLPHIYGRIEYRDKEQFLTDLFALELKGRQESRIKAKLKVAAFGEAKTMDTFDWEGITLPANTTRECLLNLDFIERRESLICIGTVGAGKTHLVTALGIRACMEGRSVRFFRTADLVNRLLDRYTAGTLPRFMKELEKCDLLILDELGFVPLHRHGAELLFNVVANCYERRSVAITTNLEFGQWNTVLGDNRLTAAMIDRLVHHAHILAFDRASWRLRHALSKLNVDATGTVESGQERSGDRN